jgi:6-pyruvoyltetrahydropterin/6-carboxytetrahydropterin synthase
MTYTVSVRHHLNATHSLPIETGPESTPHTHPFTIDVDVTGPTLGPDGFLIDIIQINHHLHTLLTRYEGTTLNNQQEFTDTTPTIEEIARILWIGLLPALKTTTITDLKVRVWESTQASASYQGPVPP